jgi:hypothetical protein
MQVKMTAFCPFPVNLYQMPGASTDVPQKGIPVSDKAESVLPAIADPQGKSIAVVQKSPATGTIVVKL